MLPIFAIRYTMTFMKHAEYLLHSSIITDLYMCCVNLLADSVVHSTNTVESFDRYLQLRHFWLRIVSFLVLNQTAFAKPLRDMWESYA